MFVDMLFWIGTILQKGHLYSLYINKLVLKIVNQGNITLDSLK